MKSSVLLDEIRSAYSKCTSFSCDAEYVRHFSKGDQLARSVSLSAKIVFERPLNLRIDWHGDQTANLGGRRCVVAHTEKIYRFNPQTGQWLPEDSVELAIAAEAGVSGGLTYFIPSLLLGIQDFLEFEAVAQEPDLIFEGRSCWCLSGLLKNTNSEQFIVAKDDLAILKVSERYQISTAQVETITTYKNINWNIRLEASKSLFMPRFT